jgi:hypothetical protein
MNLAQIFGQDGASMHVALSNSGAGYGLFFELYDEYGNDIDSVFIQDKVKAIELRDKLTEIIETNALGVDEIIEWD